MTTQTHSIPGVKRIIGESTTETWSVEKARQYFNSGKSKAHNPGKKKPSKKGITEMMLLLKIEGIAFVTEYRFHPVRKFRFDIAIPDKKIGIEYEGLNCRKSGHTTKSGYTKDTIKYNLAVAEGWRVLRYTFKTYGKLIEELKRIL